MANTDAFEQYLRRQAFYWFHANRIRIDTGGTIRGRKTVGLFAKSVTNVSRLLRDWVPVLDSQELFYVYACSPEEEYHRNGVTFTFKDSPTGVGNAWVGRDYEHSYVPGLYWFNYFSRDFVVMRGIDMDRLRALVPTGVSELAHGYLVQLYESPDEWRQSKDTVDEFLFSTPGYFSKRRIAAPQSILFKETPDLLSTLGRNWP